MPFAEMLAAKPEGDHPLGRPRVGARRRRARRSTPRSTTRGVPVLGICYGAQLVARELGGEVAQDRPRRVRPHRARTSTASSPLFDEQPPEQVVWMSHGDSITAGAARLRGHARAPTRAGRRARGPRPADLRRAVPPRGRAHRARAGGPARRSSTTRAGAGPRGRTSRSSSRRSPRSAPRSATSG